MTTIPLAPYHPLPWQVAPLRCKDPVILLTGSAGGGKSRAAAEKLHAFCLKYPGATALMLRKTRESMTNSTALFVERRVIGNDPRVRKIDSKSRFEYINGSILAWGGMHNEKQREQIRSIGQDGGADMVWLEEAHLFSEADYQELLPRMRGRAAGWCQIILTTNPDGPGHWINKRLIVGKEAAVFVSGARDNPHNPPEYLQWLEKLTGVLYDRLVLGKWAQAEGAIYPAFDPNENVTVDAEWSPDLPVLLWGCDDGYAVGHERVILVAQVTPQGGLNVFAEYSKTGVHDFQESIADVLKMKPIEGKWPFPRQLWREQQSRRDVRSSEMARHTVPRLAYVDQSAPSFRAALSHASIANAPGNDSKKHNVANGIANVRRLICDGAGVRLLKAHPRCERLIEGLQSYRYDPKAKEETPLKENDNEVDALRYLARHVWAGM